MTRDQKMRISRALDVFQQPIYVLPNFDTPEGFFLIMDEGPKQPWWYEFIYWLQDQEAEFLSCISPIFRCELIPKKFINPPSRMAKALGEFLKERSK